MTSPALLLFDVDGTILSTNGAGRRAMQAAARRLFGDHFSFEGVSFAGMLDPLIFDAAARHNALADHHDHHDDFRAAYVAEVQRMLGPDRHDVQCLPGIAPLLHTLRHRVDQQRDCLLGLLTGNYAQVAPLKLAAIDIDPAWFPITAFGDEADSRPDLVELAMAKYQRHTGAAPDPRRVIVIGDTPRDVHCAHAHGCVAFAVATGQYSLAQLRDAGADHVVPDLADPAPLLDLLP